MRSDDGVGGIQAWHTTLPLFSSPRHSLHFAAAMPRFVPAASAAATVVNGDTPVAGPSRLPAGSESSTQPASGAATAKEEQRQGIRAIAKSDVHRITSGQVVLDLQSAVKELVENALDAGSTSIGEH